LFFSKLELIASKELGGEFTGFFDFFQSYVRRQLSQHEERAYIAKRASLFSCIEKDIGIAK
jgi:hypothetical protein